MEALMWRASSVVISHGTIRAEAGGASGTQEKEKKINKGGSEKARLGEKSTGAANSGNKGKSFTLAPLPFPSARNLVPAPLRFLWFPESNSGKGLEEASSSSSIASSGIGKDGKIKIREIGEYFEEDGEKEVKGFGVVHRELMELGPDPEESSETDRSDKNGCEGSEDELSRFEDGTVSKGWFQNIFDRSFLKKSPTIEVRIPSTEMLENADASVTSSSSLGEQISSIKFDRRVENLEQAGAKAACKFGEAGSCAGCAAESENYIVDRAASPLAALEVPHVSVTHDSESFSKFLSEVPLTELKIIAQTSFLSNLAYVIPEIKAGELARYHRMLFVTSSIDIKAKALAKEKEAEALAQEKAAAVSKSDNYGNNESASKAKQASYLSPETAYALAAAATSFLRSQRKDPSVASGELAADVNQSKLGNTDTNVRNPVDSDSTTFPGVESNDSEGEREGEDQLELSSQDMPAFMRPVTSVVSAEKDTKQEVANNLRSLHTSPCEWFSCDEKGGSTRFFSIQGSDSFSSWQANLLFEPIQFEGSDLGVMVHRGIYEAAIGLYEQILPHVFEHQKKFGEHAKFRFTGHSLGGSLAMLLTLMLNIRGVVKSSNLLPVYTFGAPYIMCGGDYLLKKLGFPPTHVQYIVMNYDIVPRTFACNYPDHVVEVLKRVNGTFRELSCLTRQRLMYAPMGHLMVLQPDHRQASLHPLLPSGGGLYVIRHESHNEPCVSNSDDGVAPPRAVQVRSAQRAFLNLPHPLEIISDPGAYGPEGSIAKHHDPRNYSKAIDSVLRQRMRRWRRLQRERRRQLLWPLVIADSAGAISKGSSLGVQTQQGAPKGATSQGMCGPSGQSHFVSDIGAGRATFPVSVSGNHKGRFNRYKSLIASQHVQLGLVVFFAARLFIEQGIVIVLAWV